MNELSFRPAEHCSEGKSATNTLTPFIPRLRGGVDIRSVGPNYTHWPDQIIRPAN